MAVALFTAGVTPGWAMAQERFQLSVVVREADSGSAVPAALLVLEGSQEGGLAGEAVRRREVSAGDGVFVFLDLPSGRYRLAASAFGYALWSGAITVPSSAVVEVHLRPAPLVLDTLSVDFQRFTLRGAVYTLREGVPLTGAEVVDGGGRVTRTDVLGRFALADVPGILPLWLRAAAFGYLPQHTVLEEMGEFRSEALLHLEPDSVVYRRIQLELDRIEERAASRRTALIPPLTRVDFLRFGSRRTAMEVVRLRVSPRWLNRVGCVILDEEVQPRGLDSLERFMSDELELVEFLRMPGLMMRVYTRDFFRSRMGSPEPLRRPVYGPGGNCR